MRGAVHKVEWWMAVALAVAIGLAAAAIASDAARAQTEGEPPTGGSGFELSVNQLRINQKISQAAVRRSNEALGRLDVVEPKVAAAGTPGPRGPAGPPGAAGAAGAAGPAGPAGSAAAYALVAANGSVVAARAANVASANVTHQPNSGVYCFKGLGFVPRAMLATPNGSALVVLSVTMPAPVTANGCAPGEPSVLVRNVGGDVVDGEFFVWFED
jgi:hypothetical protein